MLYSGLVSVTFRKLTPKQVIDLVVKAGLDAIEWGGDVHCPPGQPDTAREVAERMRDAGLRTAAYGSYFRLTAQEKAPFGSVLEIAQILGAPVIRVWAGDQSSEKADAAYRAEIADRTRKIADSAEKAGIRIAYEFHTKTLTDTNESALALIRAVGHKNVGTLWQPPNARPREYGLAGLQSLLPWLVNVHAFSWKFEPRERLALAEGKADWMEYLAKVRSTGRDHHVLLEFVRDDNPENFLRDAITLKEWLKQEK